MNVYNCGVHWGRGHLSTPEIIVDNQQLKGLDYVLDLPMFQQY